MRAKPVRRPDSGGFGFLFSSFSRSLGDKIMKGQRISIWDCKIWIIKLSLAGLVSGAAIKHDNTQPASCEPVNFV